MNDARLGIVRLPLPDGREVALQLTHAALDARGHAWIIEQFRILQKGQAGEATALAGLLAVMSGGAISEQDVQTAPPAAYPLNPCTSACWDAWQLAQHGPSGRPAEEGAANPQSRRPTPLRRLFGRLFGRG